MSTKIKLLNLNVLFELSSNLTKKKKKESNFCFEETKIFLQNYKYIFTQFLEKMIFIKQFQNVLIAR